MKAEYIGYVAAVVAIVLPFVYLGTAPDWWKTRVGRAFMWLIGSLAGLFLLLLTGGIFGDYPFRQWVRALVFTTVLYAEVRLVVLFLQLRVEGERNLRAELAKALAAHHLTDDPKGDQ